MNGLIQDHGIAALVSVGVTIGLAIGGGAVGRAFVLRLPSDFLIAGPVLASRGRRVLRTVAGAALIVLGLALLALPGPGVLLIVFGAALCELPGRASVIHALLRRPALLGPLNRFRERHGRPRLRKGA